MPFITEEIWQMIAPLAGKTIDTHRSIMLEPFPSADESKVDATAAKEMEWVKAFVLGIRSIFFLYGSAQRSLRLVDEL